MRLLLISNSTNAGEAYLAYPMPRIGEFLRGVREVAFVPYAAVTFSDAGDPQPGEGGCPLRG